MSNRPPNKPSNPFRETPSPRAGEDDQQRGGAPLRTQSAYVGSYSYDSSDGPHNNQGGRHHHQQQQLHHQRPPSAYSHDSHDTHASPSRPGSGGIRRSMPARAHSSNNPVALHHNSSITGVGGTGAGDIEALLRQWGATTTDVGNDFSMGGNIRNGWLSSSPGTNAFDLGGLDSLRIDRSASFDDAGSIEDANNNNNNLNNNNEPGESDLRSVGSRHRRIASTGGNRIAIDSQTILEMDNSDFVLDPGGDSAAHPFGDSINHSALHDAARITDWPSVLELSRSQPQSAKYVGPDGWNALHHACDRRCPHVEVIDSLLSAYPEALVRTNDKGWTPLHRACRNKTPRDVVRLLLRKNGELGKRAAKMRCNDGRSSLHYALLYDAPEGVVDLLLQADPAAVLDEDRDGITPLGKVWDKYADSFDGKRNLQLLLRPFEGEGRELGGDAAEDKEAAERRAKDAMATSGRLKLLEEKWVKANTLLRAYFHFPLQEDKTEGENVSHMKLGASSSESAAAANVPRKRKWRILHAAAAVKCHPSLFLLARALHAEEALEVDENDLYGGSMSSSSDPRQSPTAEQPTSQRTALHFAAMSPLSGRDGRNVVKILLKLNPTAASRVDGYGSLPLHLICQNDRKLHYSNDGAMDVYNANPEATSVRDGHGRTPLHCATLLSGHSRSPVIQTMPHHLSSVVRNLVSANGTAASVADDTGRLPLHNIAEHVEEWNAEWKTVLDAYPAAVRTRAGPSTASRLPLHMAASSPDARPSLIARLVQANPRAASMTDGTGRLPLHLAVDSGRTSWDLGIDAIYEAFHAAVVTAEDSARRWTVLHSASASHSAGRGVIEKVLELTDGAAASVVDGEGRYPLHLACAAKHRPWGEGGVQAIFDADPSVALCEDGAGMLPFHVAAMRNAVPTTASARRAPVDRGENESFESGVVGGVGREDHDGNDDDLESLEVLFNLLIAQPSIVQV